ncbi:hypothetical protein RCL1_004872 [Eukaryota sp. TZLM3-RCL]
MDDFDEFDEFDSFDTFDSGEFDSMQPDIETEVDPLVVIENEFYIAESVQDSNPQQAFNGFSKVLELDEKRNESSIWSFKATRNLSLLSLSLGDLDKFHELFQKLVSFSFNSSIPKSDFEREITMVLDKLGSLEGPHYKDLLFSCYSMVISSLKQPANATSQFDRFHQKLLLKLANFHVQAKQFSQAKPIIEQLHTFTGSLTDSASKSGNLALEIITLDLTVSVELKDIKRVKKLHVSAEKLKEFAFTNPHTWGVLTSVSGKVKLTFRDFSGAMSSFKDSFRAFDEAGSPSRLKSLQLLVITCLLSNTDVDIFSAPEIAPYRDVPEISMYSRLFYAFTAKNIDQFENILNSMDKEEFLPFIEDLRYSIRSRAIIELIKIYSKMRFTLISQKLRMDQSKVRDFLVRLLVEGQIEGKIDSVDEVFIISKPINQNLKYLQALKNISKSLEKNKLIEAF